MKQFLKDYGVLILSIYGIVQYWIITAWIKLVHKGVVKIYEAGTIEIGYARNYGAIIGLNGTLRTLNKDIFVNEIYLRIIRLKDKAEHNFQWYAFRSPEINTVGTTPQAMELPAGFLISTKIPQRFNILFYDTKLAEEIKPLLTKHLSEWFKYVNKINNIKSSFPPNINNQEIIQIQQNNIIEEFKKCPVYIDTYKELDRKCYWEAGKYELEISVSTSKPDKVFTEKYEFEITEEDAKNLKLNVITILEEPVRIYTGRVLYYYYNAQAHYSKFPMPKKSK